MPILRTLDQDFFKTWAPEMAYVLGYFAADGSMIRNTRGAHFIEFTSTDLIMLTRLKKVVGSNHRLSKRPRRNTAWQQQYRLQIGSKIWFQDLKGLGFTPNKSHTLRFPSVPENCLGAFVRGYFDGDGNVYFKEHYSKWHKKPVWVFTTRFTSGSKKFLATLQRRLHQCGLSGGHIAEKKHGCELVFSRYDSLALYRVMYNTAKVAPLWLPRKRKTLEKAIRVLGLENRLRE